MADSKEMIEISGTYAPEDTTEQKFSDTGEFRPAQTAAPDGGAAGITDAAVPAEAAGIPEPAFEPASAPAPSVPPVPGAEPVPAQSAAFVPGAEPVPSPASAPAPEPVPAPSTVYEQAPASAQGPVSGQVPPHTQAQPPYQAETRREANASQRTENASAKASGTKKKFSLKEWVPGPNVPNQLTIARICMIPLYVIFILWVPKPAGDILAMILFILASLTDTADGYIARRYNYVTTFGKFMDPLADKLLVCSAMICLVDLGRIDSWIVIIIIAREFIISGFRLIAVEKGVVIAANIWGKVKTVIQMLMVILMTANFQGFLGTLAQIFMWFALALTIISLATYLFQNRHVLQDNK